LVKQNSRVRAARTNLPEQGGAKGRPLAMAGTQEFKKLSAQSANLRFRV
jgi:hypothetical protein